MKNIAFLLLTLLSVKFANSYNILVIYGNSGYSRYAVFVPFLQELDQRGHNLTIISHEPIFNNSSKNAREVLLKREPLLNVMNLKELAILPFRMRAYFQLKSLIEMGYRTCRDLSNPDLQAFLKEEHKFDVILVEFFNSNCYCGIINKFKAPFIGLTPNPVLPWQFQWFGTPQNPSYNQVIFMGYKTPMSFFDRVENTFLQLTTTLWYKYAAEIPGNEYSKKYIGQEVVDPFEASLYLVNTHHSLHGARPLTPSIVEVGGIHVSNRKPEELPKPLENWINNSEAGVIYFSFGSMIKGDTFPEEKRRAFATALARLPQRVLWKWENDTMHDKPDNVMIYKWMPQFDVLCHPNVKAFIAHGGLLGTTEAIQCGVPMVMIPRYGDQMVNSRAVENSGGGVFLQFEDADEDSIYEAVKKVLQPEAVKNAKALSERFKDRPLSALDTAIYWVEHVARHKGAAHMRSPAVDMPFYQYFLLDVIAFFILIIVVTGYLFYTFLKLILKLVFRKRQSKEKSA